MERTLPELRREIDSIDKQIVELIARRMELVHSIGRRKQARGLPIAHPRRQAKVMADAEKKARALRLSPQLVERIFALILAESLQIQEKMVVSSKDKS
ncbi:MAG: chorismate mutase [Deltaproteobacteria bacterium]|nr:chorismate mutase [Deltaproteobacteria bacterium]